MTDASRNGIGMIDAMTIEMVAPMSQPASIAAPVTAGLAANRPAPRAARASWVLCLASSAPRTWPAL